MKGLIASCLIICLISSPLYARKKEERVISLYFQIHYNLMPPEEAKKVKDMADAFDETFKEKNNLEIQNKVKDIRLENMKDIMESHSIKERKKREALKVWLPLLLLAVGLAGGVAMGFSLGRK